MSYSDYIRWDDTNHTDRPFGTTDIVSGQADYTLSDDDNSLDILNITRIRVLEGASETEYKTLERMFVNEKDATDAMVPNPDSTGTPTHFLEVGNTIHLWPEPDYSATDGMQIFFEREQSYFTVTGTSGDDTTEPGIPKPFHELLALHAAADWLYVNRPDANVLLEKLERKIQIREQNLTDMISLRNPTQVRMVAGHVGRGESNK